MSGELLVFFMSGAIVLGCAIVVSQLPPGAWIGGWYYFIGFAWGLDAHLKSGKKMGLLEIKRGGGDN